MLPGRAYPYRGLLTTGVKSPLKFTLSPLPTRFRPLPLILSSCLPSFVCPVSKPAPFCFPSFNHLPTLTKQAPKAEPVTTDVASQSIKALYCLHW